MMDPRERLGILKDADRGASMPPEAAAANWDAIQSKIAAGAAVPLVAAETGGAVWGGTKLWVAGLLAAGAVATGVAALTPGVPPSVPAEAPRPVPVATSEATAAPVETTAAPATPTPEPSMLQPSRTADTPDDTPAKATSTTRRGAGKTRPDSHATSTDADVDSFAEELRLLTQARAHMRAGRTALAITVLRRHGREYPSGAFEQERIAELAVALCQSGDTERAHRQRDALAKRWPSSAYLGKIRSACASQEP